jgi:hypothetical protein
MFFAATEAVRSFSTGDTYVDIRRAARPGNECPATQRDGSAGHGDPNGAFEVDLPRGVIVVVGGDETNYDDAAELAHLPHHGVADRAADTIEV